MEYLEHFSSIVIHLPLTILLRMKVILELMEILFLIM
nr:MAG TPA: hypothetical protein [Caudoviricetes sp.]